MAIPWKETSKIPSVALRWTPPGKKKQRAAKGDIAKVSGEGDERPGMDLGHSTADVSRQTEMEILGEGLMYSRHEED